MSRLSSHETPWDQLETWLNAMTGTLLSETAADMQHLSREQLDDNLSAVMSHNPAQDYSHKELAKIFGALTYNLIARVKWMKEKNSRLQRNLAQAHDQLDPVQAETRSQRETADEEDTELQEEEKGLQQALTDLHADPARREQQEKDTQEELRQAKALLIRAETELKDRVAKAKAYERHLQSDPEKEIPNVEVPLTSGLIPPKQESTFQKGGEKSRLKNSPGWETFQETPLSSHSVATKELDKLARNIPTFMPDPAGGYDIHVYLQNIDFHLQTVANVTTRDQLYLLRTTSSRKVRGVLDRQPDKIKKDYQKLRDSRKAYAKQRGEANNRHHPSRHGPPSIVPAANPDHHDSPAFDHHNLPTSRPS